MLHSAALKNGKTQGQNHMIVAFCAFDVQDGERDLLDSITHFEYYFVFF